MENYNLPEQWCILRTPKNADTINEWLSQESGIVYTGQNQWLCKTVTEGSTDFKLSTTPHGEGEIIDIRTFVKMVIPLDLYKKLISKEEQDNYIRKMTEGSDRVQQDREFKQNREK